jgi:hypothetical protein
MLIAYGGFIVLSIAAQTFFGSTLDEQAQGMDYVIVNRLEGSAR